MHLYIAEDDSEYVGYGLIDDNIMLNSNLRYAPASVSAVPVYPRA